MISNGPSEGDEFLQGEIVNFTLEVPAYVEQFVDALVKDGFHIVTKYEIVRHTTKNLVKDTAYKLVEFILEQIIRGKTIIIDASCYMCNGFTWISATIKYPLSNGYEASQKAREVLERIAIALDLKKYSTSSGSDGPNNKGMISFALRPK